MATTFDPINKGLSLVLSNNDLTATGGGSYGTGLSTTSKGTGDKAYFEVTADFVDDVLGVGIANANVDLNQWIGSSSGGNNSFGYWEDGIVYWAGGNVDSGPDTFTTGDVIGVAWDGPAGTVSFYKNNVIQSTFNHSVQGFTTPALAAITLRASGNSCTINFGATPFVYMPPSGFDPWDDLPTQAGFGFDPANAGPRIVLSNSNRTFTRPTTGGSRESVRSVIGHQVGKLYFEVQLTAPTADVSLFHVGIADESDPMEGVTIGLSGSLGYSLYHANGGAYHQNVLNTGYQLGALAVGTVISVAVDLDSGKIWYAANGSWTGDPAAGTGEAHSGIVGTFYAAVSTWNTNAPLLTGTGAFVAADLAYAPPAGFSPWDELEVTPESGQTLEYALNVPFIPNFDPLYAGPDIVLTDINRISDRPINSVSQVDNVRTKNGHSSGKWYFEIVLDLVTDQSVFYIGIVPESHPITGVNIGRAGSDGYGIYQANGQPYHQNTASTTPSFPTAGFISVGSTVCVAVDLDLGKIWWAVNGNWIGSGAEEGDPATGVHESFSGLTGTFYGAVSHGNTMTPSRCTGRFNDQDVQYPIPAGFLAWDNIPAAAIDYSGQTLEWMLNVISSGQNLAYQLRANVLSGQSLEYRLYQFGNSGQNLRYALGLAESGQNLQYNLQTPRLAGQSLQWSLDAQLVAGQSLQWALSSAQIASGQNLQYAIAIVAESGQTLQYVLPQFVALPRAGDVRYYLSGGAENTDPLLSLGGPRSEQLDGALSGQDLTIDEPFAGIQIVYAGGNSTGEGQLAYNGPGKALSWAGPGQTFGEAVTLEVEGEQTIDDGTGYIVVDVQPLSLTEDSETLALGVRQPKRSLFNDVTPIEAFRGITDYRCFYVINTNPDFQLNAFAVFFASLSTGPEQVTMGLDPAGIGDGITTGVATQTMTRFDPPAGVSFSQPTSNTPLTVGNLDIGQGFAVWLCRALGAGNQQYYPRAQFNVGLSMDF